MDIRKPNHQDFVAIQEMAVEEYDERHGTLVRMEMGYINEPGRTGSFYVGVVGSSVVAFGEIIAVSRRRGIYELRWLTAAQRPNQDKHRAQFLKLLIIEASREDGEYEAEILNTYTDNPALYAEHGFKTISSDEIGTKMRYEVPLP